MCVRVCECVGGWSKREWVYGLYNLLGVGRTYIFGGTFGYSSVTNTSTGILYFREDKKGVYMVYSVYRVYSVYSVYSVYRGESVYSVYSVYCV